jgi:hypothetical protein
MSGTHDVTDKSTEDEALAARSREREARAVVTVHASFDAEADADLRRRLAMSHDERLRELAILRERIWGDRVHEPLQRVATWEYMRDDVE